MSVPLNCKAGPQPLVSIVVLVFRVEQFLHACVNSILRQTYSNIDVVLVDDGSDDRCPAICDEYCHRDRRVTVVHQGNQGLVLARRAGLQAARGEYVMFVDGDDWIEPEYVEVMVRHALQSAVDIVVGGHKEVLLDSVVEEAHCRIAAGVYRGNALQETVFPNMICTGSVAEFGIFTYFWDKLFRTELLQHHQAQVPDTIFMGDDAACVYPYLLDCSSIAIVRDSLYIYRQRAESSVKQDQDLELDRRRLRALYEYLSRRVRELGFDDVLQEQIEMFVASLMLVRGVIGYNCDGHLRAVCGFGSVAYGTRIAIFGAGTFGQHLRRRVKLSNTLELVSWSDPNWQLYQRCGFPIVDPVAFTRCDCDVYLVAFASEAVAARAAETLTSRGIDASRVLRLSMSKRDRQDLIQRLCED